MFGRNPKKPPLESAILLLCDDVEAIQERLQAINGLLYVQDTTGRMTRLETEVQNLRRCFADLVRDMNQWASMTFPAAVAEANRKIDRLEARVRALCPHKGIVFTIGSMTNECCVATFNCPDCGSRWVYEPMAPAPSLPAALRRRFDKLLAEAGINPKKEKK